jgi:hypothetical protein
MSKEAVMTDLKRAAEDIGFYCQLAEDYTVALKGHDLTPEEAMRIGTGDLRWIQSHIGSKVDEQIVERVFIPLLSREAW